MKLTTRLAFAGLCASLTLQANAEAPDLGQVTIETIGNSGPGCTPGSVAWNLSPDGKAMTLLFDDFVVSSEETVGPVARNSCRIDLGMRVPSGWSYGLFCVDVRGFAQLDEGVNGSHTAEYTFDGSQRTRVGGIELQGPFFDDYTNVTALPLNSISWSPCGTGEVKPLTIDANLEVTVPQPVALNYRNGEKLAKNVEKGLSRIGKAAKRYERDLENFAENLEDLADDLAEDFDDERPAATLQARFQALKGGWEVLFARVQANAAIIGERKVQKELPDLEEAMAQLDAMLNPASVDSVGFMTVDSLDGHVKHHYGLAWQRCDPNPRGEWVQSNGSKQCKDVCAAQGKTLGRSPDGAQCASGELRPLSAQGKIDFVKGCWPNCSPHQNVQADAVRNYCYQPGQKRDNDKTDRAVGCFCE